MFSLFERVNIHVEQQIHGVRIPRNTGLISHLFCSGAWLSFPSRVTTPSCAASSPGPRDAHSSWSVFSGSGTGRSLVWICYSQFSHPFEPAQVTILRNLKEGSGVKTQKAVLGIFAVNHEGATAMELMIVIFFPS